MRMKYPILVGTAALLLSSLSAEELVARVEMREGSPRVVVNGAVTLPRMFWGRSNGKRTPIGRDVAHFDWKLTPHAPIEKGVFIFRTAEEKGRLVVSNLTVTAECMPARQGEDALPTGSDVARASSPLRTGGPSATVRSAPVALAAETTYTVSFDIRGEGAPWFRCGLEQQEDAVYHYHAQEVPWDDGELTSLVSQSRQALSAGCQFVTFFTANCWHDGKDDWGPYDAQFRQLIALDPKIRLVPRVTANAPAWWLRKHPECAMVFEGGVTGTYASVSSRLYRKEANAYFARLVRHLMTTYPENFAGIHFSGQNTAEWFYKDSALKLFGYDVATRDAFRAYLASVGDPEAATAEVPTAEERHLFKDAPQCLLDAKGHRRILDFQRFLQIEMCDMVGELAETCRTASEGKKLVMAFYGYHWEHAGGCSMAPANTGHYGLMRLLEKWGKNLDVLSGPVSYAGRNPIGFAGVMSPAETIARHGILWFDEDDLRVHAADGQKAQRQYGLTENLADDRRVMMRTVGMEAARGLGGWWMDLFGGGWYSDNGTWDIARELHAFERRMMARPVRVPEVAALCDEESILNLERKRGGNVPSRGCMAVARTSLAKAGVSFGQYVLEDALAKPLEAKVEFHLSTWKPRDVAALVRQVRARPDVTRVWCWAPPAEATGFVLKPIAGTKATVKATAAGRAAGLAESWSAETKNPIAPLYAAADAKADEIWATWPDGSAAVAVRKNPGGRGFSVFCGIPWMQQSFVSAVCRLGGVHQHLPSDRVGKAVLWAGNGFLTVQSHERATFAVDTGFAGGVRDALTGALLSQGPRAELTFEPGDVRILEDAALSSRQGEDALTTWQGSCSSRQGEDALTTWQGRPRPCCETKASPSFVSLAARGERPSFTVVIRAEASASERYAAEAEFGKYYERVTGRKPPAGLATFAIDPKVSASGRDAYRIRSEGKGVRLVGSNSRSLLYAVYDLLARRADCSWFWDGDVVPKKAAIDFAGLDVREESQFEYRGLRYFAHRGLTRFQAEHWGLEDWKREIDWMLKNRLNLFMLRIGQDDMFQKAFPDIVPYPDPAKPVPEAMPGYNNRSLFWSLQFRGDLRKKVLAYAFARGMQCPEDFGTMSHWYSRTPYAFLEKMKPPFLPQQGGSYGHPTDRVWDVMSDPKWLDCYWRITEASIANYGRPDLLHTIGLGERRCSTNRAENTRIKIEVLKRNIAEARKRHPGSKILLAGWDFFQEWRPEEVQALFDDLDWKDLMLWDYEADATQDFRADMKGLSNNFTKWGVIGRRPYTFGIFLCLERGLDCRANYAVLEERQKAIVKDPFCKGYIFWPESSHTDTLLLDYFTANSWRAGERTIDEIRADFCRRRYGADQAARMTRGWKAVNAVAGDIGWSGNYAARSTIVPSPSEDLKERSAPTAELTKLFRPLFDDLAQVPWDTPFAVRDTIDLARTAGDRLAVAARVDLVNTWRAWRNRKASEAEVLKAADRYVALGEAMADLLELHTDYSLWESFERLDAIEKIRLPEFEHVLVDNATCEYCRSHQAEAARHYYLPAIRLLAETIRAKVRAGDRAGYDRKALGARFTALREELLTRSLREMRPTRPRTRENFVQTLKQLSL